MMQVTLSQQVATASGGLNRSKPVRVSPAESNLVKPLNGGLAPGGRNGEPAVERVEETTEGVVLTPPHSARFAIGGSIKMISATA